MAAAELAGPLEMLPPVDFCCAYGSFLLPNNDNKSAMVDYILGVSDPVQWHALNLERNRHHYASWLAHLGPEMITRVADRVGVGVHFNPFVSWKDKVKILVDHYGIMKVNSVNLKSATSAALLLSDPAFTEEELYSKICSLSYAGDLRMLFAEDKHKVNKIVRGKWGAFREMYQPFIGEYLEVGLLKSTGSADQMGFKQVNALNSGNFSGGKSTFVFSGLRFGGFTTTLLLSARGCSGEIGEDRSRNHFNKRGGEGEYQKSIAADGDDFKCKAGSFWAPCSRRSKCGSISREENFKGLELANVIRISFTIK